MTQTTVEQLPFSIYKRQNGESEEEYANEHNRLDDLQTSFGPCDTFRQQND